MLRISNIFFRSCTIRDLAEKELHEAHRGLLEAQAGLEWAQAMVTYQKARIDRLNAYFEETKHDETDPETSSDPGSIARGFPFWNVRRSH